MSTGKFFELLDELPDITHGYLMTGLSEHANKTRISYAIDLKYFFDYITATVFKDKTIKELTIADLESLSAENINMYIYTMNDMGLSEATRAKRKSSVSAFYNYLINTERKLTYNPCSGSLKVKLPEKDFVKYLNLEEQETLLNTIAYGNGLSKKQLAYHDRYKQRDLAIIFLFLDTGLRVSELAGININDLVLDDFYVIVKRKGKNKFQKIYFSDESAEYLGNYINERTNRGDLINSESPLFVTLEGNRLSIRQIQAMLDKYVRAALPSRAEDISPHKLRSSFAMEFYKNSDKDILTLQKKLGHKSIVTTNIYAKAANEEMQETRNWRKKKE